MKTKLPSVRQIGQLTLPSSFFLKTSTNSNEPTHKSPQDSQSSKKNSRISLSDFLDRKLDKDSAKILQKKEKPFSSVLETKEIGKKRRVEIVSNNVDESVFQLFKQPRIEAVNGGELEYSREIEEHDSEIRNPFGVSSTGAGKKHTTAKHVVVIGDNSKPKLKKKDESFTGRQKPKPLYNHYASGSGWWDCDREGIDNEEVGCSDVWEGMGATTNLGGLEWH
ncbi:hypothetical protein ACHQM5_013987 [Ranunculus cassubicifolius]